MAQSVEHVIGNDEVISSILITSSNKKVWTFVHTFFVLVLFHRIELRLFRLGENRHCRAELG